MAIKLSASRLDLSNARLDNADLRGYAETQNALGNVSGATTIDLSLGSVITATSTAAATWAVSNIPSATQFVSFTLVLTNGGRFAQTWMSGTKWQNSSAPTLSVIGTDVLTFFTTDNGTSWRGSVVMPAVSGGSQFSAWGYNSGWGVLPANGGISLSSPTQIAGTWTSFSSGRFHGLGLKPDGSLWGWGGAQSGQLGIGSTVTRYFSSPVQIAGTWISIGTGQYHSFAIRTDNTLWAWGLNTNAALGLGDTVDRSSPVQISGAWTKAVGGNHRSHFIDTSGALFATGFNGAFGTLGLGDSVHRSSPVQIAGTWSALTCGVHHTIGIRSNGTLWAIGGYNGDGELGINDAANRSSPVQIGTGTWSAIAAHSTSSNTIALKGDSSLWVWGHAQSGSLGLGEGVSSHKSSPTQLAGTWVVSETAIASGQYVNSAIKQGGSLFVWGRGNFGQNGLGDTVTRSSPVQTPGTWSSIAGSRATFFGLRP